MVRWWQTRVNTIPLFDSGEKTLLPKSVLTISCAKPNQLFAVFLCRQRSFSLKAKYRSRFLYSVILTEYAAIESRVCVYMYACMCVCVCVCSVCECECVCVCVWQRYIPNGWMDFDDIFYKWSDRYLRGQFFSDFDISKSMTSARLRIVSLSPLYRHFMAAVQD